MSSAKNLCLNLCSTLFLCKCAAAVLMSVCSITRSTCTVDIIILEDFSNATAAKHMCSDVNLLFDYHYSQVCISSSASKIPSFDRHIIVLKIIGNTCWSLNVANDSIKDVLEDLNGFLNYKNGTYLEDYFQSSFEFNIKNYATELVERKNQQTKYSPIPKRIHITTVPVNYAPFLLLSTNKQTNTTSYDGFVFRLMNHIASTLNIEYEVVPPVDDHYGGLENGSWNGIVGMVFRDEADVAVAPLTITYTRSQAVDFTAPFHFEPCGILIRKQTDNLSMWKMVFIFSAYTWAAVSLSAVFAVIAIYTLDKLVIFREGVKYRSFTYCALFVYRQFLTQEGFIFAKEWSSRWFQLSWRVSVFLLIAMYTGNLTAVLTVKFVQLPFEDLQGLAEAVLKNDYKVCASYGTAFHTAIMTSESPEYKILRNFLNRNKEYAADNAICRGKLATDPKVAVVEEMTFLKNMQNDLCHLNVETYLLDYIFFPGYFGFVLKKNSPLTAIFSEVITESVEAGLVETWRNRYSSISTCTDQSADGFTSKIGPITVQNLGGMIIIFLLGLVAGILAFFGELCRKRYNTVHRGSYFK